MPGQKSLAVPEMNRSKLPGKSISGGKVPNLLIKLLAAFPPKHSFAAQNVSVPPEAPVKTHAICKSDCLQYEKEDAVDWISGSPPKHSVEKARHLSDERCATRFSQTKWLLSQITYHGLLQSIPGLSHFQEDTTELAS